MICVIRHGQTEMNGRRVLQGRSDLPLNARGIAQAEAAARKLEALGICFDRVYSSPLIRAVQTAEIVAPGVPIVTDVRLIEMDYGPYEGMPLDAPAPEVMRFFSDFIHNPAPEGMEPLAKVVERAASFMEDLRDRGGDVLISTHAIAMKGILEHLTPGSNGGYWSEYIGNCTVYTIALRDGAFGVPVALE